MVKEFNKLVNNFDPMSSISSFNQLLIKCFWNLLRITEIAKDRGVFTTAQKMKFSIKDFFSKRGQIHGFLRIWSHSLKKPLMENLIFCVVYGHIVHCSVIDV